MKFVAGILVALFILALAVVVAITIFIGRNLNR